MSIDTPAAFTDQPFYAAAGGRGMLAVVGRTVLPENGGRPAKVARVGDDRMFYTHAGEVVCAANDPFTILPDLGDRLHWHYPLRVLRIAVPDPFLGVVEVLAGHGGDVTVHRFDPRDIDPRSLETDRATEDVAEVAALAAQVHDDRERQNRERTQYMDGLVADAHQWADENDLCSRFDDFMESHGLPARQRDYRSAVEVSFTVTITGQAASEREFEESITTERVREAVKDYLLDYEDWDISDTEENY